MVKFLNKDRAYAEIVEIVSKAKNKIVLISPYIKIPADLFERLKYMDKKDVNTVVVCRGKDLQDKEKQELQQLKNLELHYDEDLHAKCFYNESSMVITSLNLYEHSKQNNREMGILLKADKDLEVFNEALGEADFIVNRAEVDSSISSNRQRVKPRYTSGKTTNKRINSITPKAKENSVLDNFVNGIREAIKEVNSYQPTTTPNKTSRNKKPSRSINRGICIRCGEKIKFNLDAPYCPECFRTWNRYKDPEYSENYCHACGKPTQSTLIKPVCYSCYKRSL